MPEKRILSKNCGKIDPGDISSYEGEGGFKGLEKARGPEEIAKKLQVNLSAARKWVSAAKKLE